MADLITQFEKDGVSVELYIEPYEFPDGIELKETWGITTHSYELGGPKSEMVFKQNIQHSSKAVEGTAFKLEADKAVTVKCTCILTEWIHDDNGELEDIIVPEEPYDQATVTLEPGVYHVWDERIKE